MKEDLRVTRTKKLLMNSLLKLTIEQKRKLADITVQDICDEAMVHRTTFYRYYTDKYDLLISNTVGERRITKELRRKNIVEPFTFFEEHAPFPNHEFIQLNNLDDRHLQEMVQKEIIEQLTQALGEFISAQSLPVPLDIAVQVYASAVGALLTYWLKNNKQPRAEEMDRHLQATLQPFFFNIPDLS